MEFDLFIGNPPYRRYEKYLEIMNKVTDGKGVALVPSGWWKRVGGLLDSLKDFFVETIENISFDEFRRYFETRNELELGIFVFNKNTDSPLVPPNKDIKKPKISIKDKIVSYSGQDSFLVLVQNCSESMNPVRYGINKGKFVKFYETSMGDDGDDILKVYNRRRWRRGLEPKEKVECKGLVAKDKEDIFRLKNLVDIEYEKTKHLVGKGTTVYLFDCMEYRDV
jgi:uncharacterized protein YdcH (DUF465 family)